MYSGVDRYSTRPSWNLGSPAFGCAVMPMPLTPNIVRTASSMSCGPVPQFVPMRVGLMPSRTTAAVPGSVPIMVRPSWANDIWQITGISVTLRAARNAALISRRSWMVSMIRQTKPSCANLRGWAW